MTRMTHVLESDDARSAPAGRSRTIQSVDRAAALLKAIADSPHPPTVVELAEACGLNRSTAWRLLATLDAHGLIERDPVSQRYSLGYALLRIAAGAEIDPLVRRARPVLERLARDTGEAANLAVARRFSLVYVDQVDPPQIMAPNWFGRAVPLHATSTGKAYLAFVSSEERLAALAQRLERYTATTVTDRRSLEQELDAVRRDGYAVCVGELEESLYGASSPVLSEQGRPVAIVSVWGTERRLPRERLPEIGGQTQAAAAEIKELLR
jgi:IclR family acetate operon transcriptional repressor